MNQCRILTRMTDALVWYGREPFFIPSRWSFNPSYMHTFAVTNNFIILIEQSLCISLTQIVRITMTHGPMTDALVWYGREPVCEKESFIQ